MSTEVAVRALSEEQRKLIKDTVAVDATDTELAMFLHVAQKSGLDPLQRQIWFVKRGGRITIQAGVDGLQARASREPGFKGMTYGVVCAKDAFEFDGTTGRVKSHTYNPFGDRGGIVGAYCVVFREGMEPFAALVKFAEYFDGNSPLWKNKPNVMIEKVARSTALRRAFPEQFSGLYEPAEMGDKAKPEQVMAEVVVSEPPKPEPKPEQLPEPKPDNLGTVLKAIADNGLNSRQVLVALKFDKAEGIADIPANVLERMAKPDAIPRWVELAKAVTL